MPMDMLGLLFLLFMGIVIWSTSSSGRTAEAMTPSAVFDNGTEPNAQGLTVVVPHHITNQHHVLRRLSQASGGNRSRKRHFHHHQPSSAANAGDGLDMDGLDSMPSGSGSAGGSPPVYRPQGSAAFLRRVMLRNTSVTCNDGTTAGYYIRQPQGGHGGAAGGSRRWLVFLEGGWHCFSTVSCHQRWLRMRNLMTSAHWPEMRSGNGILSPNSDENPYWYDANHVYIPYCSSDSWSGDSAARAPGDLAFLGSRIVEQVLLELLPRGLYEARLLLLAGSSAGAAGVLVNLDRVAALMSAMGSKAEVRGLADSGWFLDNKPFDFHSALMAESEAGAGGGGGAAQLPPPRKPSSCSDSPHNCAPIDTIKQGMKLWNGQVPTSCKAAYPTEPWRCYFGYRIYPTLRTPLFVVQWVFDEAQMTVDNVGTPVTKAQWNYIHQMGQEVKRSLENVTAVFAPSCISHIVLTKRDWNQIKINRVSLPEALRCWEQSSSEHNHHEYDLMFEPIKTSPDRLAALSQDEDFAKALAAVGGQSQREQSTDSPVDQLLKLTGSSLVSSAPVSSVGGPATVAKQHTHIPLVEEKLLQRKRKRKKKHHRRHHGHHHRNHQNQNQQETALGANGGSSNKNKAKRHSMASKERHRLHRERHRWLMHEDMCSHALVDTCNWPQCNRGCPRLRNPFTGEHIDFVELLKSFGLNMSMVADALGVDQKTLNDMNHETLLELLTKQ